LNDFLWQETPGLQQDAIDLADQAIGIYNQNKATARFNARNPFFWAARIIESVFAWVAQLPVRIFSLMFGLDQETAIRSKTGRN
jgi:hypothetical protein